MTARRLWPLSLVLGVALMIPFEGPLTRIPGMLCLVGFVVWGVFLIATPEHLHDEPLAPPDRDP